MQCKDIHRFLREGKPLQGPGVQLHLSACEACSLLAEEHGALASQLSAIEPPSQPDAAAALMPDIIFASLQQEIAQEQRSFRQRLGQLPTWSHYAIFAVLVLLFPAFKLLLKPRPDLVAYPAWRLGATLAGLMALLGASVWLLQRPLHKKRVSQGTTWTLWLLALLTPLLVAFLPEVHTHHPASVETKGFWRHAMPCFFFGIANALPLLVLAWALARQTMPQEKLITLALAAGLLGNVILQLHCPINSPAHLAISHATIGGVLVLSFLLFDTWRVKRK